MGITILWLCDVLVKTHVCQGHVIWNLEELIQNNCVRILQSKLQLDDILLGTNYGVKLCAHTHTHTIRNTDEKLEWWTGTYAGLLTCTWNKSYPKTTPSHYLNHDYFTKKITPTIIGLIASFLAKLERWATKLFAVDWPHKARDGMNKQARNGGSQWLVSPQPQAG